MLNFLKILTKRPSDKTIRIWRIIFGLVFSWAIYYNLVYQNWEMETSYFWMEVPEDKIIYIKYTLVGLWVIPLLMWALDLCVLKSKYMRIIQIVIGIFFFYISSKIIESPSLDVDTLILVMWFFPLIGGITWKCITKKCLRYKEKVTKIRV